MFKTELDGINILPDVNVELVVRMTSSEVEKLPSLLKSIQAAH